MDAIRFPAALAAVIGVACVLVVVSLAAVVGYALYRTVRGT